jgi:hypothetical protein
LLQLTKDNWNMQASWIVLNGSVAGIRGSVRAASDTAAKEMDVFFSVAGGSIQLVRVELIHDPDAARLAAMKKSYELPERFAEAISHRCQ